MVGIEDESKLEDC